MLLNISSMGTSVLDTIQELTQIGLKIRESLASVFDRGAQEELILTHIKAFSKKGSRIGDFQAGLEWFNVGKELSIYQHLKGKIVILDFFTYCCINCMHVLPDLNFLEEQFPITEGLVIIGVHSAKFSNERDSRKLLSAIQRYNIRHPVVNDATLTVWRHLGISCWPTLVMLGPTGEALAVFVGEGHRDELVLFTQAALAYFKRQKKISTSDIPLQPSRHLLPATENNGLLFPSKLEVFRNNEQGETLVVADTGNNRILVVDAKGNAIHVIGGTNPGYKDGNFDDAKFNAPQGVCILNDSIYVADNENHAIRKINLSTRTVSTIAGTGVQGHDYVGGKNGKDQDLSSPWDVAVYEHEYDANVVPVLLIAAAGTHQIWALFLEDTVWWKARAYKAGTCVAIVGTGREENRNNAYPHAAGLAQPSGLSVVQEEKLAFFADSESSAIRSIDLRSGRVAAVCGGNKNPADLHDYGDCDGVRYEAKLQHPLGITWHSKENSIYVADTYNHKIKRIDPNTGYCETLYGNGKPDESFSFDEPSGIAVGSMGDLLYVTDTNNHAVKVIDTRKKSIGTLSIKGATIDSRSGPTNVYFFDTSINEKGGELNISFGVTFARESDLKLNAHSPQKWSVEPSTINAGWIMTATNGDLSDPVRINVPPGNGINAVYLNLYIIACRATECVPRKLSVVYRVHRETNASATVSERKELVFVE